MAERRWKFWGWGLEGSGLSAAEERRLLAFYAQRLGLAEVERRPPPTLGEITLRAPRLRAAGAPRRDLHRRALRARRSQLWQVLPGRRPGVRARL